MDKISREIPLRDLKNSQFSSYKSRTSFSNIVFSKAHIIFTFAYFIELNKNVWIEFRPVPDWYSSILKQLAEIRIRSNR